MRGLLADGSIEGYFRLLVRRLEREPYREFWVSLNPSVETLGSLGLARDISDSEIWQICQREQLILITGNRNADGPDSLEETIRGSNTPSSLPVFTLANPTRISRDAKYAELVAEKLMDRLIDIEILRGVGRIYLP